MFREHNPQSLREAAMPMRCSDALGVAHSELERLGAFDSFIDIDSPFHVDPFLLRVTTTPELAGSHDRFERYFAEVLRLLAATDGNDPFFGECVRRLTFHETPFVALGYSKSGASGSGIGPKLATALADTALQIIRKGIADPVLFELVGLLQEGVGADRISDMTIRVILPDILAYSQRAARELGTKTKALSVKGTSYQLPLVRVTKRPVILIPMEIIRDLPVAQDWDDVERVCAHNEKLRNAVNKMIGRTWRHATSRISKAELRSTLLQYPGAFQDLIDQYKAKVRDPYDFHRDPLGAVRWHEASLDYAKRYPLSLPVPSSAEDLLAVVYEICQHFARLVEDNGLYRLLYDPHGKPINERYAQLLFFGIADAYCEANNLDLSREPNAGRGPVDFKISRGYEARITVEVKYSANPRLVDGYLAQLPAYNAAEQSQESVYLVIRNTIRDSRRLAALHEAEREARESSSRAPEIVIVDGRWKPTASKL
jgi:hypothetical protein